MKIYTKTGDKGTTSLVGSRVSKHNARVIAYGTVDEANSFIGVATTSMKEHKELKNLYNDLLRIQHTLFDCGGDLAIVKDTVKPVFNKDEIKWLENIIDQYSEKIVPLQNFILPGGTMISSHLHVARTVVRRAEREVVTLKQNEKINEDILIYLNRLSDFLFVAARFVNMINSVDDVPYIRLTTN